MKKLISIVLALFLAMSFTAGTYAPKTITKMVPLPSGTPLIISNSQTLESGESVVSVVINSAMTTAYGITAWLDSATPVVTPVAGTTAFVFYGDGGNDVIYKGAQFGRGGLNKVFYSSLTRNVSDDTKYFHFLQTGNQDNAGTMFIDTMK